MKDYQPHNIVASGQQAGMQESVYPAISVIIPTLNEEKYIGDILNGILQQGYPLDKIEVLVVDAGSNDATTMIVSEFARSHPFVRILSNPDKAVPFALNLGIKKSTGEIIIILGAHSSYPSNYFKRLVFCLHAYQADNVGGVWETCASENTLQARVIALAMSHSFGVGNALFRTGVTDIREADTVPFGCYRRSVFDKIGLFDTTLLRSEDDELNGRLRKAGGRILIIPDVKIRYFARSTWKKLWQMYFYYGYYKPFANRKLGNLVNVRQLAPPLFVGAFIFACFMSLFFGSAVLPVLFILTPYMAVCIFVSLSMSLRKMNLLFFPALCITFMVIHFSYGFGYLKSLIDFYILRMQHGANPLSK